jgi:hypothetical protein
MWILWVFWSLMAVLGAKFLPMNVAKLNSFSRPFFEVFNLGLLFFAIVLCGGFRFWLARIRNSWIALIPFFLGMLFAYNTGNYGVYLVPEFCLFYQVLCGIFFAVYLPLFINLESPIQKQILPPAIK